MFCSDIESPFLYIFSNEVPSLLYYSHFSPILAIISISLLVFIKNKHSIIAGYLLSIAVLFSVWAILDIVTWANIDSRIIMYSWSLMNVVEPLIFVASLFFTVVYIRKSDPGLKLKIATLTLLLPVFLLLPSEFNLKYFDLVECEPAQGYLMGYVYFVEIVLSIIIIFFLLREITRMGKEQKRESKLFFIGILLFLITFSWANIVGNITSNWEVTQYGLFGMTFFMGVLAYIIVKFKAFNIKLIGAQALVSILILLVASQYTFAQNAGSIILTGITLALSIGFGYVLIKSIKTEVQRKDELQFMADALAQSNDKLRQLDNAKTEFVSIASHQLRTPLTAIKGFVSLLMEGSYGEMSKEAQDALGKVHLSTERLIHLVEELLNVSRIESGRMEYKFENQDICILLEEMVESFEIIAKENNLSFEVKLPDKRLPQVSIDSAKMREVMSNLVDNAFKYTKKGGVTVKAEFGNESHYKAPMGDENNVPKFQHKNPQENIGTNGYVRITVSDTGIGIPASEIPYLFAKFSRGKDTQRLHVSGTGLGLYVGKGIVEAHKGHIWIESDGEGRGSRFIVELPAA